MRRVITFLGVPPPGAAPRMTEYTFRNQIYQGRVFAEALLGFAQFDEMLVFVTPEAERRSYPVLAEHNDSRIRAMSIPKGETTAEMWSTFEIVTGAVAPDDTVIFDITHGLRSIPFLVFLAAAFLQSAKGTIIEAIYYGALELGRHSDGQMRPAPVIDLSEFVSLLAWMNASEQFVQTGNAAGLVTQLRAVMAIRPEVQRAANDLEEVSQALRLILPDRAMVASHALQESLGAGAVAFQEQVRPFVVLAERVNQAFAPLVLRAPRARTELGAALATERAIIHWYLDRNMHVQALAVAREWLISWVMVAAGFKDMYDQHDREEVERVMGQARQQRQRGGGAFRDHTFPSGQRLAALPQIAQRLELYGRIGELRNMLLHAGKRHSQKPRQELEANVRQLCGELDRIPLSKFTPRPPTVR